MDQGEVDYSLAVVRRYNSQVSLVKYNTAEVLYSCKLVGIGPKLLRIYGLDGYKY
jgi:hypothetical protein